MQTLFNDLYEFDLEYAITKCYQTLGAAIVLNPYGLTLDQTICLVSSELYRYLVELKKEKEIFDFEVNKLIPKCLEELETVKRTNNWRYYKNRRKYGKEEK